MTDQIIHTNYLCVMKTMVDDLLIVFFIDKAGNVELFLRDVSTDHMIDITNIKDFIHNINTKRGVFDFDDNGYNKMVFFNHHKLVINGDKVFNLKDEKRFIETLNNEWVSTCLML